MGRPQWLGSDFPGDFISAFVSLSQPGNPGECWAWPESQRTTAGYGRFSFSGMQAYAHRVSYVVHNGFISADQLVRHKCDFPPCWNPRCLLVGTHADNCADAVARDRVCHSDARAVKMTSESARALFMAYHAGRSIRSLACAYDLSVGTVHRIVTRKLWRRATADLISTPWPDDRWLRGEDHPQAKATNAVAAEIRLRVAAGEPRALMSRQYGLSKSAVQRIVTGQAWA